MNCRVIRKNGRFWMEVNGEQLPPMAYITYCPDAGRYAQFREDGVRLFSFHLPAGDQGINIQSGLKPFCPGFFIGSDTYDFSHLEKELRDIAPPGSRAYVIPRVYLDVPVWWEERYPGELSRDYGGMALRQSFASAIWRADMKRALEALLGFVENSPWRETVIGYQIAAGGTEEWAYQRRFYEQLSDYSDCNTACYQKWLGSQYADINALNRAYGTSFASWNECMIPAPAQRKYSCNGALRKQPEEQRVIDYYRYHNWVAADAVIDFCGCVKALCHGDLLAGAFYGYTGEIMNADFGHHSLSTVLNAPSVDFMASPNSYLHGRCEKNDWPYMSMIDSARLHQKLWFLETDTRTAQTGLLKEARPEVCPDAPIYEGGVWAGPESQELALLLCKRNAARMLTGNTGLWWFDMWGGWFDAPPHRELIRKTQGWLSQQRESLLFPAEIAVVVDESGFFYSALDHPALYQLIYEQRNAFSLLGAPVDWYLAQDLECIAQQNKRYKMIVALNMVTPSASMLKGIERIKSQGCTLVWVYLTDVRNKGAVTGFSIDYDLSSDVRQGVYQASRYPEAPLHCGRFSEVKASDYVLARFIDSVEPCVLWRQGKSPAVCSLLPNLPAALLREIATLCGVHLYYRSDDILYAGGHYLALQAMTEGWKRLTLRHKPKQVVELFSGQPLNINGCYLDLYLKPFESALLDVIADEC